MLGLSPDGEHSLTASFEKSITLKRPYQLIVLIEMLENCSRISQASDIAKELLTSLTSEQLVLVSQIDSDLVD